MFIERKKSIVGITALILLASITSIPSIDAGGPVTTLQINVISSFGDDTFDFAVTGTNILNPSIVTVGGTGTSGAMNVDPGTYSVQEIIPSGWDLTTASCTDGSSTFSIDTVSGIIINFGDVIECTFENIVSGISEPDQVTGLFATSTIGSTTIELAWNTPFDGGLPITGYTIERESPIGGGFSILVADTGSTTTIFEDTNLLHSTQYNYKVSAINAFGTGLSSSADSATIFTPTFTLSDQTSCEAAPFFGDWNASTSQCTITDLTVEIGETLHVDNTAELIIAGTLDNFGIITSDARIHVPGSFNNEGSTTVFQFNVTGTFDNLGTYTGLESLEVVGGVFNNHDTVFNENGCSISPSLGGIVNNHGIIFNKVSGTIESGIGGTINNFGTINNVEPSIFIGAGSGGIFNNFGIINNVASSQITSSGTFDNSGTINNLGGSIDISDTLNNFNLIDNLGGIINISPSGTIDNQGIICDGTLNNLGTFTGNPLEAICAPATLTIIKLSTGGDDTFDFTVTGPTSYNPSIGTVGGVGISGPTNVPHGTYSVQETIPSGWDLTTASCDDGSSSFSVDVVSGIVIAPADILECTFENQLDVDVDNDGIFNLIDLDPVVFSEDFEDIPLGGTTDGFIVERGDQILTISEETNPDGVRTNADISGGLTFPATVEYCSTMSLIDYNPGDETVVTCSSVTITVISGQPLITFYAIDDTEAITTLTSGNSITFDQDTFSFTTPPTNTETVIISVNGNDTPITPGATVSITLNQVPDCSGASPSQASLWPPNHKLNDITIDGVTDPEGDPITINIDSITQDEPTPGPGSKHSPDGDGVGTDTAEIRAERDASGDGRVYEITFTADDGNDGECSSSVQVNVLLNQGGNPAVNSGQNYDSTVE